jgi:acetolactate synthase-1/2/3 large subunit
MQNFLAASEAPLRDGGTILVDALKIHGVDMVFSLPGESFLPVLDALYDRRDDIRLVTTRHEAGAANMAEAYGKLTGRPGICFVTRGPGATQASIGVHNAMQDSTPMILFIGQINSGMAGREAWQEIDYRQMFGAVAKLVIEIDRPDRIPEIISRAFHTAVSGRPGPVVISLPEDVLNASVAVADAPRYTRIAGAPRPADLDQLFELLDQAERPLVIVGGSGWTETARGDLRQFVEAFDLPIAAAFRRQDIFDNEHANYVGHIGIGLDPALQRYVRDSDLVVAVGARLGEPTTGGYTLFDIPEPRAPLVHVHADPSELGRVYKAQLMINAGMPEFAAAVAQARRVTKPKSTAWREAGRSHYVKYSTPVATANDLDLGSVMMHLRGVLPADAIITNGAGNYTVWVHRFHRYRTGATELAPTSGAMGYGVPAAVSAKLLHPDREVLCFAGDGCFLMSGQEMATASQYRLGIVFLVINNGMFGTIRMHQEREYPARVYGTDLENPDFVALARAYGGYGELVTTTGDFAAAFARARAFATAQRRPALLELRVDAEAITPSTTLSRLREQALAAQV